MIQSTKKEQIYKLLKERIEGRAYVPGSRLPKEVELSAELGVSRKTLRPVLEQLAMENLIERVKGKGTFIRDAEESRTKILVLNDEQDISNPFHYIFPGVQIGAETLNATIELCSSPSILSQSEDESATRILKCGFQGIIWFANNFNGNEPQLPIFRKTGLPILLPHAIRKDRNMTGFHVMGVDFRKVIEDGLRYLARQGHQRVAHIASKDMRGVTLEEYFQCVRMAGLDEDTGLLYLTDDHLHKEQVLCGIDFLMRRLEQPPSALLCFSDFFAVYVYEYCSARKIRIPDDIAVLSIGGQIGCNFMNPTLSAIDFNSMEIGRNAIRYLLEIICGKRHPVPFITSPHRIVERESTRKLIYQQKYRKGNQL